MILVPLILFLVALIVLILIGLIQIYFSGTGITSNSSGTELIAVTLILFLVLLISASNGNCEAVLRTAQRSACTRTTIDRCDQ